MKPQSNRELFGFLSHGMTPPLARLLKNIRNQLERMLPGALTT